MDVGTAVSFFFFFFLAAPSFSFPLGGLLQWVGGWLGGGAGLRVSFTTTSSTNTDLLRGLLRSYAKIFRQQKVLNHTPATDLSLSLSLSVSLSLPLSLSLSIYLSQIQIQIALLARLQQNTVLPKHNVAFFLILKKVWLNMNPKKGKQCFKSDRKWRTMTV